MQFRPLLKFRPTALYLFFLLGICALNAYGVSTIAGRVYDQNRNGLAEVDVELLNDYYQSIQRAKTDGSGRYQFNGLSDGRYSVRVYAFRFDLEDQTLPQEVLTQNIRGGEGTGYFVLDFYLRPKRGGLAEAEAGVIFAQDVPEEAKRAYDLGLKDLSEKRTIDGIMSLNKAVQIFPTYFAALSRAGRELYHLQKYTDAVPFLMKAIQVNEKSPSALYYLGNCFYFLGKDYYKASIRALGQAAVLAPGSPQIKYSLGRVERRSGNFSIAEEHLLQAKKLSKDPVPDIQKELVELYSNDLKMYGKAADELEVYLKASKSTTKESEEIKFKITELRAKASKS